jgi:hypothetical protein
MVTANVPAVEPVIVHVDVCVPLMLAGEQVAVTPEGEEPPVRATVPVKPPVAVRPTNDVALSPAPNETEVGFAPRAKSGDGGVPTVTLLVAMRTFDPLVPVIVTV